MDQNRLFISWSRSQAGEIAPLLKTFCQDVLGIEDIFLSKEIDSGRRWSDEIAEALESCNAGLIIVTDENKGAPWLNFEAGAISKKVADANVIPLLWDIKVGDIADTPLNQFQSKTFSSGDILFVMQNLANLWDLSVESVVRRFNALWPALEQKLTDVPSAVSEGESAVGLQDLYGLIQRVSSRLSGIENAIENFDGHVAAAIYGQSEFATASPQKAAELIRPFLKSDSPQRNALADFVSQRTAPSSADAKWSREIFEQRLAKNTFFVGQRVMHGTFGLGMIETLDENLAQVRFDDGEVHTVELGDLT